MPDPLGLRVRLKQSGAIPLAVNLTCEPGELVALVGPSGSGKTTILRTIAGLYRPHDGQVSCDGVDWLNTGANVNIPPYQRRVGLVFQSYALFPHMTALANVTAAMAHLAPDLRETRARELLRLVHLNGFESRKPSALSGGQQQRVAVARALARDPAVLLLDEPFSAVDRRTRRQLQQELRELRTAVRTPILLVTHDLDEAMALADQLCVLDKGETLQTGRPADVLAAPASARVREALDLPAGYDPD